MGLLRFQERVIHTNPGTQPGGGQALHRPAADVGPLQDAAGLVGWGRWLETNVDVLGAQEDIESESQLGVKRYSK